MNPATLPRAFFLPAPQGSRFALFHPPAPQAPAQGSVLYLHPFAEELNATRRVVAQQARALAQVGFAVLQVDLHGCGDSEGEFAEADWATWLEDARAARAWLAAHVPSGPRWLWGLRSGALLAPTLAADDGEAAHLLLWQPVASGQQMLQQFLRLHAAAQWLAEGDTAKDGNTPARRLAAGEAVDIAGYRLSPALAAGLGAARLQPPPAPTPPGRLVWLDLSLQAAHTPSPATTTQANAWRNAGWQVRWQSVQAPAFWQTVGGEDAPRLLEATLAALLNDEGTKP